MNTQIKRQVTPYDLFVINTKDGYNDPYKLAKRVLFETNIETSPVNIYYLGDTTVIKDTNLDDEFQDLLPNCSYVQQDFENQSYRKIEDVDPSLDLDLFKNKVMDSYKEFENGKEDDDYLRFISFATFRAGSMFIDLRKFLTLSDLFANVLGDKNYLNKLTDLIVNDYYNHTVMYPFTTYTSYSTKEDFVNLTEVVLNKNLNSVFPTMREIEYHFAGALDPDYEVTTHLLSKYATTYDSHYTNPEMNEEFYKYYVSERSKIQSRMIDHIPLMKALER